MHHIQIYEKIFQTKLHNLRVQQLIRCFSISSHKQIQGDRKRVVVTGIGLVTPLGTCLDLVYQNLIDGAIATVALNGPEYESIPCRVVASVSNFEHNDRKISRATAFALSAAEKALTDAHWFPSNEVEQRETGVAVGMGMTSFIDILQASHALQQSYNRLSPYFIPKILTNLAAGHISIKYGLKGPNHSVSTACTTGAHSIGDAFRFISNGDASVMVCGGTEANINPLAIAGFSRMKALSTKFNSEPNAASRPFDRDRDGFVMGEGAGVLVLEELSHAKERNVPRIYAEVLGYGLSADAHHISSPNEDGDGAFRCMKAALREANVLPEEVGYVNAHATSTPMGDKIEVLAIKKLFNNRCQNLAVSSIKGSIGHLLGAAGSVEAAVTALSCCKGIVPPTVNLFNLEKEMDLNFVANKFQDFPVLGHKRIAITNSFGFGGTNASICFASV